MRLSSGNTTGASMKHRLASFCPWRTWLVHDGLIPIAGPFLWYGEDREPSAMLRGRFTARLYQKVWRWPV
jgi:hypothetical protein